METLDTVYSNPLVERYASKEMNFIFSNRFKFTTWRKLWVLLAEAEKAQGLNISAEQISEMKANIENIDWDAAKKFEKELRHDVMAHVHTFALAAPKAAAIIHLGATSAFVGDNTDLIQMREGLKLIRSKIQAVLKNLSGFAQTYKNLPCLAWTHFQPAQPTTVGKRACLWMQELMLDLAEIEAYIENMPFRGVKGTTGTQASFMSLFNGDHAKCRAVDEEVTRKCGFKKRLAITGQTYTRKIDQRVTALLSAVAQSASKFAVDMRLLMNRKEMEEPFEAKQIGSSAMAYKRNPMRCERIGSLARFVSSLDVSTTVTASTQWFERTLDDSANKRLAVAQAFLALDAILDLWRNVTSGMVVYDKMIERNLNAELPFMITENILMEGVKRGGNRQELHEKIRVLSIEAGLNVKQKGLDNNLLDLIEADGAFKLSRKDIDAMMDASLYTGRSSAMVDEFLKEEVEPALKDFQEPAVSEIKV